MVNEHKTNGQTEEKEDMQVREYLTEEYLKAAEDPNTTTDTLDHMVEAILTVQYEDLEDCEFYLEDFAMEIANNPNVSDKSFEKIVGAFYGEYECRERIEDSSTSSEQLLILVKRLAETAETSEKLFACVLSHPHVDAAVLDFIARTSESDEWYVARDKRTSADTLMYLANSDDALVREEVAKHPNVTDEIHIRLAEKKVEYEAKLQTAKSPDTTPDELYVLASNSDAKIRETVAGNKNVSAETLEMLAKDDESRVVIAAARFVELSVICELMDKFYFDWNVDEDWRFSAYDRDEILNSLAVNKNNDPDFLHNFMTLESTYPYLAANPSTDSIDLYNLALVGDYNVRLALSENPSSSSDVLAILANDSNWDVRENVARHPNTNTSTLEMLAKDDDSIVVEAAFENSHTPLHAFVKSDDIEKRQFVAASPRASERILAILAKDEDVVVRMKVVNNPNVTATILCELVMDDDEEVREIAAKKLESSLKLFDELI